MTGACHCQSPERAIRGTYIRPLEQQILELICNFITHYWRGRKLRLFEGVNHATEAATTIGGAVKWLPTHNYLHSQVLSLGSLSPSWSITQDEDKPILRLMRLHNIYKAI